MNTTTSTSTQESFEAWAKENGFRTTRYVGHSESGDTYFSYETEQRWLVWQAAKKDGSGTVSVQDVQDMAALIRRLSASLKQAQPDSDLASRAVDYLKRKGLQGSVLREEPQAEKVTCGRCNGSAQTSVRAAIEDGEPLCSDCNGKGYHWEPIESHNDGLPGTVASFVQVPGHGGLHEEF